MDKQRPYPGTIFAMSIIPSIILMQKHKRLGGFGEKVLMIFFQPIVVSQNSTVVTAVRFMNDQRRVNSLQSLDERFGSDRVGCSIIVGIANDDLLVCEKLNVI